MEPPQPNLSGAAVVMALSAATLGMALHVTDGLFSAPGVVLLSISLVLCVGAVYLPGIFGAGLSMKGATRLVVALLALQMLAMLFKPAGASAATVPATDQHPYCAGIALAIGCVGLVGFGSRRLAITGFAMLLAVHAALGVWKIRTAPHPKIDVYDFHADSARAMAQLTNPYTITFPNIYGPDAAVYAQGIVRDGRLHFGFPYPPLVLLATAPSQWIFGDFRYSYLAAMLLSGVLIAGMRPDRIGLLIASMLLFTPRAFYVLESGWTEPLSVVLLAGSLWAMKRHRALTPVLIGLLVASKQYLPVLLVLAPLLGAIRSRPRQLLYAILVAAAVSLPLVLWDIQAFVHSAVTLQLHQPYRADSLSLLAWFGSNRPRWVGLFWAAFVVLGLLIVLSWWRRAGFATAACACLFGFFAFNKQAFANYYYLVLGAMCVALASELCTESRSSADDGIIGPCATCSRSSSSA